MLAAIAATRRPARSAAVALDDGRAIGTQPVNGRLEFFRGVLQAEISGVVGRAVVHEDPLRPVVVAPGGDGVRNDFAADESEDALEQRIEAETILDTSSPT